MNNMNILPKSPPTKYVCTDLFRRHTHFNKQMLDASGGKRRKRCAGSSEHPRLLLPHCARREVAER